MLFRSTKYTPVNVNGPINDMNVILLGSRNLYGACQLTFTGVYLVVVLVIVMGLRNFV